MTSGNEFKQAIRAGPSQAGLACSLGRLFAAAKLPRFAMKIENYDNRRPDVPKLYAEGHSYLFVLGVMDGYAGAQTNRPVRPSAPVLQVRRLPEGQIQVSGNTFPYKDHLKRLGGRWQAESKSWSFPSGMLDALKADSAMNESEDLWSGIPDYPPEAKEVAMVEWNAAIEEYGRGYVFGQEEVGRKGIGRVKF
jgi:hypothetical protein